MAAVNNRIPGSSCPDRRLSPSISDGNFQTGIINREQFVARLVGQPGGANAGFGVNDQGQPMFDTCYNWATRRPSCQFGADGTAPYAPRSRHRQPDQPEPQLDAGCGAEPEMGRRPNDLRFNFDGQYVEFEDRQL